MANQNTLQGLGPHFQSELARHHEAHENKTLVQEERQKNVKAMQDRLERIKLSKYLAEKVPPETNPYPVDKLDTGTEVSALLASGGAPEPLVDAAKKFTDPNSPLIQSYLEHGPISANDAAKQPYERNTPEGPQPLVVKARLQTRGETVAAVTETWVHVGSILDPESILVLEPFSAGEETETYGKVIGPDDSRFAPIMDMVQHVNDAISAA